LFSLQADRFGDKGITSVAFSPDGQLLAIGSEEPGIMRIWRLDTGQAIFNMRLTVVGVRDLAFSPDGHYLVASDNSGWLSVWYLGDASSGGELEAGDIQWLPKTKAHNAAALGLSISPDGSMLATASPDGTVKVWDIETRQALLTFEHTSGLTDTAFSPDGRYLATAGVDQAVHFFVLDRDELIELAQSRVTRSLTTEECRQYLHVIGCPEPH
jgi:WD40 repeat protein